jgi:DNA-binding transcriptional ArsR family regulator
MKQLQHPELENLPVTEILYALADPVRLGIVTRLYTAEEALTCSQLSLDRPRSSMSHHFKVLRESGIIRTHIAGKEHFNLLRKAEIQKRFPGLLDSIIAP